MTTLLALLSLLCVTALVAAVSGFVVRIGLLLRSAEESVTFIAGFASDMHGDGAAISPDIESMNQNLYRVAMHLAQLGDAAERLSDTPRA